jgi:hypothetical protein
MEPNYVVVGFYKNQRRFLMLDNLGRIIVTESFESAVTMTRTVAAVAALAASSKFNLANVRAVSVDEAENATPI